MAALISLPWKLAAIALRLPNALVRRVSGFLGGDSLMGKSALSLADQAVVSGTNFAVTVILGSACGKPELGAYYLLIQVLFFARGIQEQLIAGPYYVFSGTKQGRESALYAGSSLIHELLLLTLAVSSILLVSFGGERFTGDATQSLLPAILPLFLLREFARQFSFAHLRVAEALAIDLATAVLQLGSLLALRRYGALDVHSAVLVLGAGWGLTTIAWFARRRGTFAVPTRKHASDDWRANWRFSRWALAGQLTGCSLPYALPWVIALTHGTAATSELGVGTTLIGFANMFILGMSNFICPRAARAYAAGGIAELRKVLGGAMLLYVSVLAPFACSMILCGSTLMAFVYGPDFASAGTIMAVLSCGALINSLGILAGNGLWAMNLPAAGFRADVASLLIGILAAVLLIGPMGPLGAAIAGSCGTAAGAAVRIIALRREMRRNGT